MSFLSLGFLFTALAAGIPVMLHMIHRQNLKELPFASLRFIRISEQKTRNKRRIQDLTLLLLRMAVLIAIAFALAKPVMRNLSDLWGGAKTSAVIIIDNSASMGTVDGSAPRLDAALQSAERILGELDDGDRIAVLVPCGPRFPENGVLYTSQQQVRKVLQQVKISYERADLSAAVAQARHLLHEADTPSRLIFVLSDQQQVSWQAFADESQAPEGQPAGADGATATPVIETTEEAVARLDATDTAENALPDTERRNVEKIPIILVNFAEAPKPNVGLVRLDMRSALPIAQVPIPIAVRMKNEATIEQTRRIEVYVDGDKQYASADIALGALEEGRHDFTILFDRGGLHKGEVRLVGSDGNKYDDKLFFALEVDQGIPVAVVKGAKHEVAFLEDTFYLQSALSTGAGGVSPIRLTLLTPEELAGEPLTNYAAVICVNLPAPDADTAERLVAYAERGGNLIWTAGDNVYAEQYNEIDERMQRKLLPLPILPIQTPDFAEGKESWSVGMLDEQYPPFRNLLRPRELYTSVLVYKRVPFDLSTATPGSAPVPVLARLDDGEPLIVQRRIGQGTLTMFGTNLHVSWSNLPLKRIFVPMINQMIFQLAGVEQTRLQTTAGNPLMFSFKEDETPTTVEIIPPTGAVEQHELAKLAAKNLRTAATTPATGKSNMFVYNETRQIGVYQLRPLGADRQTLIPFSVNIDGNEIDGAVMDEAAFKRALGPDTPLVFTHPGEGMDTTFSQLKSGTGLWDFFLIAVLIGLVIESYVSNKLTPKKSEQEQAIDARRGLPPKPATLGA